MRKAWPLEVGIFRDEKGEVSETQHILSWRWPSEGERDCLSPQIRGNELDHCGHPSNQGEGRICGSCAKMFLPPNPPEASYYWLL